MIDAMNVIGSVPDGWWKDRDGALARLVDALVAFDFDEWVVVVADGRPVPGLRAGTRGNVELRYAGHSAPDAADDEIIALLVELKSGLVELKSGLVESRSGLVESRSGDGDDVDQDPVTVVSSDAGLITRAEQLGARSQGVRSFRKRIGW